MNKTKNKAEVEPPKVFCHLEGYPPEPGENMQEYLARINPLLDAKVREREKPPFFDRWFYHILLTLIIVAILVAWKVNS